MKTMLRTMIAITTVLWSFSFTEIARAITTETEEAQLQKIQQETDRNAAAHPDQSHAEALAQQFEVSTSEIERLRNDGQGWGEIKIELAMARHLVQMDPNAYPAFTDALKRVENERDLGKGWGKISDDLGFKLGPVIREAQHERKELRMETKEASQESRESIKETQKESKQMIKENEEAIKDVQKGAKEIGKDKV